MHKELKEEEMVDLLKHSENKIRLAIEEFLKLMSKEQAQMFLYKMNQKLANLK